MNAIGSTLPQIRGCEHIRVIRSGVYIKVQSSLSGAIPFKSSGRYKVPKLTFQHDIMSDFENYGREAEPYLERQVIKGWVIALLLFCSGIAALVFSNMILGAVLLVSAVHFDQQSNTHHVLLILTKYHRAMAKI